MATYRSTGSVTQNAANLLTWMAWCEKDGAIAASATNCTVTLYKVNGDGTETAESGATETDAAPTANDTFNGSMTVALDAGALYYFLVDITVDAASRLGAIPLGVPVRTA